MSDTDLELSPLVFTVTVEHSAVDAFTLFTDKIGTWWPKATHSIGEDRTADVVLDPRVDGRLYERLDDGTEYAWGEVLEWDPPNQFVITWHPSPEPIAMTTVEVSFTPIDERSTEVKLTHRDWHRLGDIAAVARRNYAHGWVGVLDLYVSKAATPP